MSRQLLGWGLMARSLHDYNRDRHDAMARATLIRHIVGEYGDEITDSWIGEES